MRLSARIFLCAMVVITLAISITGYLLIDDSFKSSLEREQQRGFEEYQLLKFTMQTSMLSAYNGEELGRDTLVSLSMQTASLAPNGDSCAVYAINGDKIFSTFSEKLDFSGITKNKDSDLYYHIEKNDGKYIFILTAPFTQNGSSLYFCVGKDITSVVESKSRMLKNYALVYSIIMLASALLMFFFSELITGPIQKLMRMSRRISNGMYHERTDVKSSDEIGALSDSFNRMAETVEDKMNELVLNAQQKEDFVGNFAHELKTPLTSVIGYADMIYQKDLPREEVQEAAGYIMNEGMRLESLAHKMMDLIVMNRTDFVLMYVRTDELLQDVKDTLLPMMSGKNISFGINADAAYIRIEYDLFKTLLLNLCDNASKADSTKVAIFGMYDGINYKISIRDNGRGIPKDKLERITEAFYMVDKSRSRKQHGAGLGLAICKKIADIHETKLEYESEEGVGTIVSVTLPAQPIEEDYGYEE